MNINAQGPFVKVLFPFLTPCTISTNSKILFCDKLLKFSLPSASLIDCTKNAQSGLYQIIDSQDHAGSTANLNGVTDAGKSSSLLTYRSGAMQGAVSACGYDGDYSYPACTYGAYYN